ncbi:MAG: nitrogen regulation protein NR(II) [Oceanicoccus sp.]|uniref:nitrogen regulation protein NR(II) n=1 Tax=Oceanicoccus sp. TaxID=2691044 RepID=UPI00261EC81C|nr:nitrogen regulation protein NR(II) [Oceanicoccus sp.]MCP3908397.1 nitrogen regulation protein NR(II) [Oceanicoccus sp.]MDG1773967.1 nitrogen regulation protein NR(II) [Oceanicoccus sp.]
MAPDKLHTDILDNLQTAILLVDTDLSVSYINTAAQTLLDVSGNQVLGEPISQLFTEVDKDQANLLDAINNISAFTKREAQLLLSNGQTITVDCAVSPIIEHDVTTSLIMEIQPLNRLLRISREEGLLSSQQNSQALIRGMAHEIKNPLGGLRGAAQLLAKELPNEGLQDYTNIIIEEADRLSNLVDNMLGSNKLLDLQAINIHEVLERVKSLVDAETGSQIKIARDYDPSIPDIEGDKERLIQAILNIVRNAMQVLIGAANVQPVITLKTRTLRQFTIGTHRHRLVCRADITDNGPGIADEIRETIFLPMVSGRADGTGLGLSFAQSIINHHHGLIECNSEPGNTTFSIFIPLSA